MPTTCPGCGVQTLEPETCQDLYNKLSFYTLNHPDINFFVHQYVVDAYAAQHANDASKPITVAFALIGLYLAAEKSYTGRQVQLAHMQLANSPGQTRNFSLQVENPISGSKREWPAFALPKERGTINVEYVLNAAPFIARDEMIKRWVFAVWQAFEKTRPEIINLLAQVNFQEIK